MSSPISRVLSWTVIHLGPASPQVSSNLPESSAGHAIGLLFGLAPGGVFHRRELLPVTRCALTAPFQPYRRPKALRRYTFCCTFHRLAPPRRYLAPCPVEPGLSSPSGLAATVWRAQARRYRRSGACASKTVTPEPTNAQSPVSPSLIACARRYSSLRGSPVSSALIRATCLTGNAATNNDNN